MFMLKFSSNLNPKYLLQISDLKKESIRGGFWSIFAQVVNFSIQIIGTMVLARMLFPEDYGLMAMVGTLIGFVAVFRDMGLSTATIQTEDLDDHLFSSIFFVNLILGFLLTFVFALMAPLVSWFFDDDRLFLVTLISSTTFFIASLSSQLLALLKRSMNFNLVFKSQIISGFSGILVSILLAYLDFGYWALVWGPIFSGLFMTIYLIFVFQWFPKKPIWDSRIKRLLDFGKHMTFFEIINYFSRNLDNILIGRFFGSSSLGIYNKAYVLLMLPINQIRTPLMNVALPALSSLKNNKINFQNYYLKFVSIVTLLCCTLVLLLIINSNEIIYIVLGPRWAESSKIFLILGVAAIVQPLYGTFGLVLIALGQYKKYSTWGRYNALIIVPSFLIGINFNLEIFAICYVIANYITFFFSAFYVF